MATLEGSDYRDNTPEIHLQTKHRSRSPLDLRNRRSKATENQAHYFLHQRQGNGRYKFLPARFSCNQVIQKPISRSVHVQKLKVKVKYNRRAGDYE
uniref:Uncharacterized protein n=1 Tax=Romanomermis culicivorax TaxID=13658 RepID=A0A915L6U0_ROMCU